MSNTDATVRDYGRDIDEYYATFGRFIDEFSRVEQRLQSLLWEISGTSLEVARAAFGDARFDKIVTIINRLYDSKGEEPHPSYRRAVEQLGHINRMRNDIVHIGVALIVREDLLEGLVSNSLKAMPGREKQFTVTTEMIENMSKDLTTIMGLLIEVLLDRMPKPAEPDRRELGWRQIAKRPWQYTPPKQSAQAKERRKHRPAQ